METSFSDDDFADVELSIFSGNPFKCINDCKEKRFEINNLKFQILIYSNKIK